MFISGFKVGAFGQLESAWPVSGSVLVLDDQVYAAAGRSSFLDGGIFLYCLDPATGKLLKSRSAYGPFAEETGFPVAVNATGEFDVWILLTAPSFSEYGRFWDAYPDSDASDLEDQHADALFLCPGSALWDGHVIETD